MSDNKTRKYLMELISSNPEFSIFQLEPEKYYFNHGFISHDKVLFLTKKYHDLEINIKTNYTYSKKISFKEIPKYILYRKHNHISFTNFNSFPLKYLLIAIKTIYPKEGSLYFEIPNRTAPLIISSKKIDFEWFIAPLLPGISAIMDFELLTKAINWYLNNFSKEIAGKNVEYSHLEILAYYIENQFLITEDMLRSCSNTLVEVFYSYLRNSGEVFIDYEKCRTLLPKTELCKMYRFYNITRALDEFYYYFHSPEVPKSWFP